MSAFATVVSTGSVVIVVVAVFADVVDVTVRLLKTKV